MDLDEELIKEVKTQRVLYNPNDPLYKNMELKQKIWWEIGQKILNSKDESTAGTIKSFVIILKLF